MNIVIYISIADKKEDPCTADWLFLLIQKLQISSICPIF